MPPGNTSSSDDPFESISNFFDSGLWTGISLMLQIFVVLLWLALAYWTYQDARRRITTPGLIYGSVGLAVLLPFLGAIIYLIVRPPEYLDEARERELELLALEQRLAELGDDEGKQIVGRLLAREGLGTSDGENLQSALRSAGVAWRDELKELTTRMTELEFRMRVLDRASEAPMSERDSDLGPSRRRVREVSEKVGRERDGIEGRRSRLRRRSDEELYE